MTTVSQLVPQSYDQKAETDRKTVKEHKAFIWDYSQQNISTDLETTAVEDLIYLLSYVCLQMKVKCDHRSKFSNLSNWKQEA